MRIGTDILNLKRFQAVLNKFNGRFVNKILSASEREFYEKICNDRRRLEFLGGRFCGKEAIFKAVSDDFAGLTWKKVSILPNSKGRPQIFIDGQSEINEKVNVSISHEEDYVISTAIFQ